MDKGQAIHSFWSGFGLNAYDQNTIPTKDENGNKPELPYITYEVVESNVGNPVPLNGSIWYRSKSWADISQKAKQIAASIGYGYKMIKIDGGYMYITKGSPFIQRMSDEDDSIRRIYINLTVEFLTAY